MSADQTIATTGAPVAGDIICGPSGFTWEVVELLSGSGGALYRLRVVENGLERYFTLDDLLDWRRVS
jgi:hypothetical protein